ncbi:hypothetical protein ACFOUP_10555 [Belliella kenyensis]|uniref:Outer membrane protein beta-barrel domain-containing protein n=1 Tax=Belliella kenyensis TaxID=1472724 RepID=A0ABV8EL21_9BACT|nr:hypothetical protein [Belliella kenyensis]MCH7400490.1 hypothetical protein [Belliella kenyensis]MDN3604494.1 hypothetical protein [Belliella kenyensis]
MKFSIYAFSTLMCISMHLILNSTQVLGQNFFKYKEAANHSIILGGGPSIIYADNGGRFTQFRFKFYPSFTLGYSKAVSDHLDVRLNVGHQRIGVREADDQNRIDAWIENGSAIGFSGFANFVDVMPTFKLIGTKYPLIRPEFNLHLGAGVGILQSRTNLNFGDNTPNRYQQSTSFYIPIRSGLSYQLNPNTDLIFEGSMFITFTDEIDGNVGFNRFNDHLFQFQIMVKRYLNLRSEY